MTPAKKPSPKAAAPTLPDDGSTISIDPIPVDQLASDGEAVKEGLPDEG